MDPVPAQADATEPTTVPHAACRSLGRQPFRKKRREPAWARLSAKVYDVDPMLCFKCGSRMAVIAVILDPAEIRKIIACLAKHGRGPPTVG